jgi:S-formylglutathione hydrolase FrmB
MPVSKFNLLQRQRNKLYLTIITHNEKEKLLLIALLLVWVAPSFAAKVDTLLIKSPSMNKDVSGGGNAGCCVGKESCCLSHHLLLHGYGGNAKTWIGIKPNLPQIADEKGIIFVCPDGKKSWYWDSPVNPSFRYETFISSELVKYIDEHYKTIADRKGRAITGLSMGGHGAMWNAIRHKDTFGAGGSTSGGMDIRPFPKNWDMSKQLGEYESNKRYGIITPLSIRLIR